MKATVLHSRTSWYGMVWYGNLMPDERCTQC